MAVSLDQVQAWKIMEGRRDEAAGHYAIALAILDLIDAVDEAGEKVATALGNVEDIIKAVAKEALRGERPEDGY